MFGTPNFCEKSILKKANWIFRNFFKGQKNIVQPFFQNYQSKLDLWKNYWISCHPPLNYKLMKIPFFSILASINWFPFTEYNSLQHYTYFPVHVLFNYSRKIQPEINFLSCYVIMSMQITQNGLNTYQHNIYNLQTRCRRGCSTNTSTINLLIN